MNGFAFGVAEQDGSHADGDERGQEACVEGEQWCEADGVGARESLDVASSTEEVARYIRGSTDMFDMHATHYADVFTQV